MTIHNKQWHNFAASEARALGDIISESTGSIISECPGDFIGIRILLDSVGDAPPQQIRTEGLWRLGPEQLAVSFAQIRNRRGRQPIQFGLDRWIGCLLLLSSWHHALAADLATR